MTVYYKKIEITEYEQLIQVIRASFKTVADTLFIEEGGLCTLEVAGGILLKESMNTFQEKYTKILEDMGGQ